LESNYLLILTFKAPLTPALFPSSTTRKKGGGKTESGEIRKKNRAINKGTDEKRGVKGRRRRRVHVSSSRYLEIKTWGSEVWRTI